MNSYSPNLAVNTLLSLDTAAAPRKDAKPEISSERDNAFSRAMSEQERPEPQKPRQQPSDRAEQQQARKAADAESRPKPNTEDKPVTRSDKPAPDEADVERQTVAEDSVDAVAGEESKQHAENSDGVEPVPEEASADTEEFLEIELTLVEDQKAVSDDLSPEVVTSDEALVAEDSDTLEVDTEEVEASLEEVVPVITTDTAAAASVVTNNAAMGAEKVASAEQIPSELKPYRVNASGKPLTLVSAENSLAQESSDLTLGQSLKDGVKIDGSAALQENKSSAAVKQMSQLMNQLGGAQPVVSTEQALKELAARAELPAARGVNNTAVSALSAAVSRTTAQQTQASLQNNPANALQAQVKSAVGQPKWQAAISERVAFMASQNIKSAEIQLDPPELGPLQVRVTVNQDQASVAFASHHAQVREALDQTAFRLRDMLQQEGMSQVDVDVSGESFSQESGEGYSEGNNGSGASGFEGDDVQEVTVTARVSNSLVDHFV